MEDARDYWRHPSQQVHGARPDAIDDNGFVFYADGALCLAFHDMPHQGFVMVHCAMKPEGWGRSDEACRLLLREAWGDLSPHRIVAWVPEASRAVVAFARRVGFVRDGVMPGIVMMGWTPCR